MINISRPTLLLDEAICKSNILSITSRASKAGVVLRPHFKTHQSHEIGRWFREAGVTSCTVSSIQMAEYFAMDGWTNITVAFPVNYLESDVIDRLAAQCHMNILAVAPEAILALDKRISNPVHCFIEIDTGYGRTGVKPEDDPSIESILQAITNSKHLSFAGFLTHAGQSYAARHAKTILEVHESTRNSMVALGNRYRKRYPNLVLSIGDTPTCSIAEDFAGIQEIRPGNLVFYDVQQTYIGACRRNNIAIALACPVVAVYRDRQEVVVHGGSVHFSKDVAKTQADITHFGEVVQLTESGWKLLDQPIFVKSLSQEHGIISWPREQSWQPVPGDVIGVLPVHACLTADAMGAYVTTTGQKIPAMPSVIRRN
ncbi:MAG TPA: alanine racemase [Cyclobacteriaceae bacterium]|nr:alanine racemase [Cyclobacteriaceae bacterium]